MSGRSGDELTEVLDRMAGITEFHRTATLEEIEAMQNEDQGDIDWKRHKEEGEPLPGYPDTETVEQAAARLGLSWEITGGDPAAGLVSAVRRIQSLEAENAEMASNLGRQVKECVQLKAERDKARKNCLRASKERAAMTIAMINACKEHEGGLRYDEVPGAIRALAKERDEMLKLLKEVEVFGCRSMKADERVGAFLAKHQGGGGE